MATREDRRRRSKEHPETDENAKQAVAIGLSKARKHGIPIRPPGRRAKTA